MKKDFSISASEMGMLSSCIGKELVSCLMTDADIQQSFGIIVLRFADTDIEINAKALSHSSPWFDETNTIEVHNRPDRDSISPLADELPDGKLERTKLMETLIGKVVRSISLAVNTMTWTDGESGAGDYVRGIVLHLGDEDVVFDKGGANWSELWTMTRIHDASYAFKNDDAQLEGPEVRISTSIVRLG